MTDLSEQMIVVGPADEDRWGSGRVLEAVMKPADLGDGDDMPGETDCTARRHGLSLSRLW